MTDACRFVLLGTGGNFTCRVLQTLCEQGFIPLAYIQSGTHSAQESPPMTIGEIPIQQPDSELTQLLEQHHIPLNDSSTQPLARLIRPLQADYLLVACWPERLSDNTVQSVSIAALNLHPSMLPAYRGADPISDQLNTGDVKYGVSLHLINQEYDSGDIVLQKSLSAENLTDKTTIETLAATVGASLFMQAVKTHDNPGWHLTRQLFE